MTSSAVADDDERLARQLHEELNCSSSSAADADERMARKLQACELGFDGADAALAAALAVEPIDPAEQESASLALALSLHEEPQQTRTTTSRRRRDGESERMRQHLFGGAGAEATAASRAGAPPPAPPLPSSCGPSYAMVVGHDARAGAPSTAAVAPPSRTPPASRAPAPAPAAPLPRGPALIIDGANVAYSYGLSRGAPSGWDAEGIRQCVLYFARRMPREAIAVTLNEGRWDPHDAALCSLSDGVLAWTPPGKDDDVFLLQSALDHGAWVVTNDRWKDHRASRHATDAIRRRVLRYAWVGGTFAPASDDLARFDARGM